MNEKQKIRVEVQKKLDQFATDLRTLRINAETDSGDLRPDAASCLQRITDMKISAERKFNELMTVPEEQMAGKQTDLMEYMDNIDRDIQRVKAYFK
jgi:hypothetical protein